DRVLRHAAVVRLAAQPALAAGLSQADVHVVGVADRANRRPAIRADTPHLAGRHRDLCPAAFAGRQRGAGAGAAANLATAARLHFEIVDRHAQRNAPQGDAVAHPRLRFFAADDLVASLQSFRGENIAL